MPAKPEDRPTPIGGVDGPPRGPSNPTPPLVPAVEQPFKPQRHPNDDPDEQPFKPSDRPADEPDLDALLKKFQRSKGHPL